MDRKTIIKFAIIFLVSFLITVLLQFTFHISLSDLKSWVSSFGPAAPIAYSTLLFVGITGPFVPISDLLVFSLAAFLFSPLVAILATFVAHSASLTASYWLARWFGRSLLRKFLSSSEVKSVEDLGPRITFSWILGLRFLPLTAIGIDAVSYAAGLEKMDFGKFLVASLIPWTTLSVLYFLSAGYVESISPALILLPASVLLGMPILIFSFRHRATLKDKIQGMLKN